MMTNLSQILSPENILLDLEASDKNTVFDKVGQLVEAVSGIPCQQVAENLLEREKLGSTGLGLGVAVPHGRIQGLKAPIAVFVRLATPMDFGSPDGAPVNLMVSLLVPASATQKHLETLSEIAEMFSSSKFRTALLNEPEAAKVYQMITTWLPGK